MKTSIVLIFTLVFTVILSNQVVFAQANISIGIIGGPTAANFSGGFNAFFPKKWMPAFSAGAAVRVGLKKNFFFQTDISYERKGFSLGELEFTDLNGEPLGKSRLDYRFNYVMLTPSIGFCTSGKVRFEASLGIFGGYLMAAKSVFTKEDPVTGYSGGQFNLGTLNHFDIGSTMRLGVGFDLAPKWSASIHSVGNLGLVAPFKPIQLVGQTSAKPNKTASLGLQFGVFYTI